MYIIHNLSRNLLFFELQRKYIKVQSILCIYHFLFKRHLYETGLVLNFPDSLLFICSPAISGVSGYQFLHIWKLVLFGGSIRKQTNKQKNFFQMCTVEKENILSVHLQNYANCADWVSKGILNIDSCLFSFVPSSSCQH